jgi:hypothetical protein
MCMLAWASIYIVTPHDDEFSWKWHGRCRFACWFQWCKQKWNRLYTSETIGKRRYLTLTDISGNSSTTTDGIVYPRILSETRPVTDSDRHIWSFFHNYRWDCVSLYSICHIQISQKNIMYNILFMILLKYLESWTVNFCRTLYVKNLKPGILWKSREFCTSMWFFCLCSMNYVALEVLASFWIVMWEISLTRLLIMYLANAIIGSRVFAKCMEPHIFCFSVKFSIFLSCWHIFILIYVL